jgi:hypothetical protein
MENKNGPEIHIGENTNTDQKGNSYLKEMETAAGENRLEAYYQTEKNKLTARLKHSVDSEDMELTDSIWRNISALEEAYRIVKKDVNNKNIVKICPKCGIEYENSAKFCGECGQLLILMQCACGEIFRKKEDGSFDKFCMKCGQPNPFEQAKQGLAEEDRKKAEELHIKDEKNKKQENKRQYRKYIDNLKAGDIIKFGSYPFEADGTERPIEWIILERYSDDTALLISKYCLDARRFDSSSNNWEQSEIRQWLNNEFWNETFKDEEKKAIIKNREAGYKVFLLSEEEAEKYFKNNNARKAYPTPCAKARGVYTNDNYGGSCWWWLRFPDDGQYDAADVDGDGSVDSYGFNVYNDYIAVRVALKINLNNL